ncbi:MAG: hypothetical protein ACOC7S_02430 [Planctomycetota bacterium]
MRRRNGSPLEGWDPRAVVLRFVISAAFGFMLALAILATLWLFWYSRRFTALLWGLLAGVPLVCGIVGVFWFEPLIDWLRTTVEDVLTHPWGRPP